jgi:hypothetical protein
VEVVGRVAGTMTTDFGAPDARGPWDEESLDDVEANRLIAILEASWRYFDRVVSSAPMELAADSEGFRTPVPIESVHRFRSFRTPRRWLTSALL